MFESLGVSRGAFACGVIVMAVAAFAVTTRIERKVAPETAPSLAFPAFRHLAAGAGALALGVLLVFLPDYRTRLARRVADPAFQAAHPVQEMTVDELAFRILDQEPQLRILDLRAPAAYAAMPLPGSVNLAQGDLFGREWAPVLAQRRARKVLVADDEASERTACLLARELGFENFAVLKGGFPAFARTILDPAGAVSGDRVLEQFRADAQARLRKMIADDKNPASKAPKKEKAVQGGC